MSPPSRRTHLSHCVAWLYFAIWPLLAGAAAAQSLPEDWQVAVRQRVSAQDLTGALDLIQQRLTRAPGDLEALGWRGRVHGWLGRWDESERDYRAVLEQAPRDVDILVGLGRTLRAVGRRTEARELFVRALAVEPGNAEALQGLASLREPPRHRLTASADTDQLNFTPQDARAVLTSVRSDWTARWTTDFGMRFDHRAGLSAARWSGAATTKLPVRSALTVGGAVGRDNGIVARAEIFTEYGRGLTFRPSAFVRGVELSVRARRLWFDGAGVATFTPAALVYLPRDWTVTVAVTAARSAYPGLGSDWQPSTLTRVAFPVGARVAANAFFVAGAENFALRDQIGSFSARTVGGGFRLHLQADRELSGYVAYQVRSQGRRQTSLGVGYVLRF